MTKISDSHTYITSLQQFHNQYELDKVYFPYQFNYLTKYV